MSSPSGLSSSAAAEGVGALRSATKSAIVKSTSWPTALTMGISLANMALATISSLKGQRSSNEPPPRPTINASHWPWRLALLMASTICAAAGAPCTGVGKMLILIAGKRRLSTDRTSLTAAPVAEVITPTWRTDSGMGFLCWLSNRPSAVSCCLSCSNCRCRAPNPASSICSITS